MNLDDTFIVLMGYTVYEPGAIITNLVFFALCLYYFLQLVQYRHRYARQMAWFILFMGAGSLFGAIAHGTHYQLGEGFFNWVVFIMNALSLMAIYYCFKAPYMYYKLEQQRPRRYVYLAWMWIITLLAFSFTKGDFTLIKINAAVSLFYSMAVHYLVYKQRQEKGSILIVSGILISFVSIIIHTLKFSIHQWFNYKDLAHLVMILSLVTIYQGIKLNSQSLSQTGESMSTANANDSGYGSLSN